MIACMSSSARCASVPVGRTGCYWPFSPWSLRCVVLAHGNARELGPELRVHSLPRNEDAFCAEIALQVRRILVAERLGGERVILRAFGFRREAVLLGDLHGAGVGAVVRAG